MSFEIVKKDTKTRARAGILRTTHGAIKTPSYVMVATHANIKLLKPSDVKKTKTQAVIANTYHLWQKAKKHKRSGHLLHKLLGAKIPIMTDSGGFQIFSFGAAKKHGIGKISKQKSTYREQKEKRIKITEKGVYFYHNGKKQFMDPDLSIELQERLGADIIFAFDECTSPLHNFSYTKKSMERTHKWALKCIETRTRKDQMLYGIVQGGYFKSLRIKSAKYIASLSFDGFGVGGAFNENQLGQSTRWIIDYLPEKKPRHLLGIGYVNDIFTAIENGIDTFDCVIPTREGRHGRIWTHTGSYDIRKSRYGNQKTTLGKAILEPGCKCPVCKHPINRSQIYTLFKAKRPNAGRYASIHNMWFFNTLLEQIRNSILRGKFLQFKTIYLRKFTEKRSLL